MGESGQIVEFSMSPEEIATEDTDSARHVALRKEGFNKPRTPVASFEMAESGIVIEFRTHQRSMQRTGRGKLA